MCSLTWTYSPWNNQNFRRNSHLPILPSVQDVYRTGSSTGAVGCSVGHNRCSKCISICLCLLLRSLYGVAFTGKISALLFPTLKHVSYCDKRDSHSYHNVCHFFTLCKEMKPEFVIIIHLAVCLTTGPKPLPKRTLHIVRFGASSFKREYHLLPLGSSGNFPRLLPRLPVTSIPPFIFPSITCCRRQFLRIMWPTQLAFLYLFHIGYFSAPWLYVIRLFSHDWSNWSSPSFSSTTFQNLTGVSDLLPETSKFQHHKKLCSKCSILPVSYSILSQIF